MAKHNGPTNILQFKRKKTPTEKIGLFIVILNFAILGLILYTAYNIHK
jgi:hypothetical protein